MGILIIGTVALDSVITPFGSRNDVLGGSATYSGIAASYFTDVRIVAVVGDDFPEVHVDLLKKKGIDTEGIKKMQGNTFRWKGEYGYDMNSRTTLETQLNVFSDFDPQLSAAQKREPYLFLGNLDPDIQNSVLAQMENPKFVACDTMNLWIETKRAPLLEVLKKIDLLVVNDEEARMLADTANLLQAAQKIIDMGPKRLVIKRGEYGAMLFGPRTIFSSVAFPIENVTDPTGAGDAFAGGMMGYLSNLSSDSEVSLRKAVVYGSIMASFSVTDFGPQRLGDLTFTEIDSRYREFCKTTLFEDFDANADYSFSLLP
ncbi:MAG: PfkB family carbohydrate kinase [Acidobacteriota bacterium]